MARALLASFIRRPDNTRRCCRLRRPALLWPLAPTSGPRSRCRKFIVQRRRKRETVPPGRPRSRSPRRPRHDNPCERAANNIVDLGAQCCRTSTIADIGPRSEPDPQSAASSSGQVVARSAGCEATGGRLSGRITDLGCTSSRPTWSSFRPGSVSRCCAVPRARLVRRRIGVGHALRLHHRHSPKARASQTGRSRATLPASKHGNQRRADQGRDEPATERTRRRSDSWVYKRRSGPVSHRRLRPQRRGRKQPANTGRKNGHAHRACCGKPSDTISVHAGASSIRSCTPTATRERTSTTSSANPFTTTEPAVAARRPDPVPAVSARGIDDDDFKLYDVKLEGGSGVCSTLTSIHPLVYRSQACRCCANRQSV